MKDAILTYLGKSLYSQIYVREYMRMLLPHIGYKKIILPLSSLVVLFISILIKDFVTQIIHPFNIWLLNLAYQNTDSYSALSSWWVNSVDIIPTSVTVVIVGLIANWLVERSDAKAKQIELKLKKERLAFERNIAAVYKHTKELEDTAHRRTVADVEEIRAESSKTLENNDKLWAKKLEGINDIHTKEILSLVDLVGRMKDNLEHEEARRSEKTKKETGTHPVKIELLAHINLQEDPFDLIKEANAILEKYNL